MKQKDNGKRPWILIAGVVLLVLTVVILVLCLRSCGAEPGHQGPPGTTQDGLATGDEPTPENPDQPTTAPDPYKQNPDLDPNEQNADPDSNQQDPDKTPNPTPSNPGTQTPSGGSQVPNPPADVTVPEKQLLECERYASFDGAYVEDGSDEPVLDVAAILVTNVSEEYLDMGQLTFDLDGQEATFVVTGLPSGASAWVMEASRKTVAADSAFIYRDMLTSFREEAVNSLEGLQIQTDGTMLKVTNQRDKTLRNVTLYYKVLHSDGNYFGGITYMVAFGDLEPGQSAEKLAGHFKEGWTDIVRIGYQEAA